MVQSPILSRSRKERRDHWRTRGGSLADAFANRYEFPKRPSSADKVNGGAGTPERIKLVAGH
jgi:hypothetical protein